MSNSDNVSFSVIHAEKDKAQFGDWVPTEGVTALTEVIHRAKNRWHTWLMVNPGVPYYHTEEFNHSSNFSSELIKQLQLIGIVIRKDSVTVVL